MLEKVYFLYISPEVAFRINKPNIFTRLLVRVIGWKIGVNYLDSDNPKQRYALYISEYYRGSINNEQESVSKEGTPAKDLPIKAI